MSADNAPPPPAPESNGSMFPAVLSILFVVFIAGTFIGFNMCAKNYNSGDEAGFGIFIVSAVGLVITTLVAFIRLLIFILKKFDPPPPEP